MTQTWTDDVFAGSHDGMTDLQNMENNFAALKSMFSGLTAPSSPVAFQPWGDSTNKVLKYRNAGNTAWVGVMAADWLQAVWFYVNSAIDGWTVWPYVYDKVLSLKGGSVYISGATEAGSFSLDVFNHNHQFIKDGTTSQKTYDSGGSEINTPGASFNQGFHIRLYSGASGNAIENAYTSGISLGDWRPAAAVGTLQVIGL